MLNKKKGLPITNMWLFLTYLEVLCLRGRMKRFFVQLVVAAMLVTGVVPSVTPWETAYAEEMTPTQEVMHPGQSASAEQMPPSASESEVELVEMKPSHSKVTLKNTRILRTIFLKYMIK
jgi:hypothetical protein